MRLGNRDAHVRGADWTSVICGVFYSLFLPILHEQALTARTVPDAVHTRISSIPIPEVGTCVLQDI